MYTELRAKPPPLFYRIIILEKHEFNSLDYKSGIFEGDSSSVSPLVS